MTKFRIFAASGVEVCTIEADFKLTVPEKFTNFYKDRSGKCRQADQISIFPNNKHDNDGLELVLDIPYNWVAIPEDIIVKNENKKPAEIPRFEDDRINMRLALGRY